MNFDCLVIIRSANERTVKLCKNLILLQGVSESQIVIVEEVPFSKSLAKSFAEGIKANYKWTFCVDADVLLRPKSILKMLEFAEAMPSDFLEVQGFVMDKFFGGPRPAGNHLYRTSFLSNALKHIPKEGIDIRPESRTLNAMANLGYPFKSVDYIVGIHDDYQYNFDIFRKCFVQAFKHGDRYNLFMTIWKQKAKIDQDFLIALKGFAAGVLHQGDIFINRDLRFFKEQFDLIGVPEKQEFETSNIDINTIEAQVQNWQVEPVYLQYFPSLKKIAPPIPKRKISGWERVKLKRKEMSIVSYKFYILGFLILKMGERLMLLVDRRKTQQ